MNKKVKKTLLIVGIVILLVGLAVLLFFIINPKKTTRDIFTDAMQKNIKNLTSIKSEKVDILEKILTDENVKIKISTDTTVDEEDFNESVTGDLYYNKGELYSLVSLTDSGEKYEIEAVLKDSKLYHKVKDVYSKFYYTDVELEAVEASNVDTTVVFEYLLEALDEQVKDIELMEEEKELTLDGKVYKVNKITANFTAKDLFELLKKFMLKIKGDKEIYSTMNEIISGISKDGEDFNDLIDELEQMINSADDEKTLFTYSTYLDGEDVLSNEFVVSMESEGTTVSIKFVIDSYVNSSGKKVFEMYLSMMGIKMMKFKSVAVSDTKSEIILSIYNTIDLEGVVNFSDKDFSLEVSASAPEYQGEGNLLEKEMFNLSIESKEVKKEEEYDFNFEFIVNDEYGLKIESENTLYIGKTVSSYDISDSADISEMTGAEKEVYEKIFG